MWKPERILTATDFSQTANDAVQMACAIARRTQASVDLVHALDPGPQPLTGYARLDELLGRRGQPAELEAVAREALEDLAKHAGPPAPKLLVRHGVPTRLIQGLRLQLDADLLVLGSSGLRSLRRFVLGSVADRALRIPGCPLLLVREAPPGGEPKKILVAAEYPDRSTPWLETALALAHHLRSEAYVLHVLPPRGYVSDERHVEMSPKTVPGRLEQLVASQDRTIPTQISVRQGDAATVIPRVAKRVGADLVVLGAERSPDGWPGRVADRVARAGLPALLYVWPEREGEEEFTDQ